MPRVSVVKFSFIARFWRFKPEPLLGFSKRWDSMSMWANYAAQHTGCCFEFANAGCFASARAEIPGFSGRLASNVKRGGEADVHEAECRASSFDV